MPQFGASTVITPDIKLILLDCFETLVELNAGVYRPRKGIVAFLEHFQRRHSLAVATDTEPALVDAALKQAGIGAYFKAVFHAGNAVEQLGDGRIRKRLDLALAQFGVQPQQALFIGDSPLDAEAAGHYRIPFIRVPRSEDRNFTFTALIAGPSRYNSAEFSATFIEHYLADHKKRPDDVAKSVAKNVPKHGPQRDGK